MVDDDLGRRSSGAGMTTPTLERAVRRALARVRDPCSVASATPMSLEEMGLIDTLTIDEDGVVHIRLRLTTPICLMVGVMTADIRDALAEISQITDVDVTTDSGLDWHPGHIQPAAAARRRALLRERRVA
jgi:metal-sulfur cluster biosynthetic enzyme